MTWAWFITEISTGQRDDGSLSTKSVRNRRPRRAHTQKTVSLALQGGGGHGAFTWACSMPSSKTGASA